MRWFIGSVAEVSGNGTVEKSFVEKLGGIAPAGGQLQEAASVDVDSATLDAGGSANTAGENMATDNGSNAT